MQRLETLQLGMAWILLVSVKQRQAVLLQSPWLQLIQYQYEVTATTNEPTSSYFSSVCTLQVSLLLTLPFSSPWLALLGFICVSPQYPPSLQIPFPSSPAVLHNLISCDVFLSIRELLSISIKFKPFQRTHNAIISYKIQAQFRPYRL